MTSEKNFLYDPRPKLGQLNDVPIPSGEILKYAKDNEILRFKNLTLHVLTTMVVANTLITEIERANIGKPKDKQLSVNPDLVFETLIATHAVRPLADDGAKGESSASINRYMKDHDDIELAELIGVSEGLPLSVIQQIQNLEHKRGFPINTIGPSSMQQSEAIDWNSAIDQIASWSVAGTIQPIDRRFEDLISRIVGVQSSPRKLSEDKLLSYKEWGKDRIAEICRHLGIDSENYLNFLRDKLFEGIPNAQEKSKALISELFPEREARDDEFLPVSPAYIYLSKSIMSIDDPIKKNEVERMLEKPAVFIRAARRYGLVS